MTDRGRGSRAAGDSGLDGHGGAELDVADETRVLVLFDGAAPGALPAGVPIGPGARRKALGADPPESQTRALRRVLGVGGTQRGIQLAHERLDGVARPGVGLDE